MKRTQFLLLTCLFVNLIACENRPDLATRLAEERRLAEAKTPPSVSEFLEAARRGDAAMVLSGLERGVDANAVDDDDRSALQLASFDGHEDVVKLLLERHAEVDHRDRLGRTALMFAATGPNRETVELLADAGAALDLVDSDEHFTALMFAAAEGQLAVVESLIRAGANPDLRDIDNDTALSFAAKNGHAEVVQLLESVMKQRQFDQR